MLKLFYLVLSSSCFLGGGANACCYCTEPLYIPLSFPITVSNQHLISKKDQIRKTGQIFLIILENPKNFSESKFSPQKIW